MDVFISWSGPQSKRFATILRHWLPSVIQAVRPYFSPDDIGKGTRWNTEISANLEKCHIGLICVTSGNLTAEWIMFEAGALSKSLGNAKVIPLLFGVEPTDIKGPLVQFQAAKFAKDEFERVIKTINTALGESALASEVLSNVFEMWWPQLESDVNVAMEQVDSADSPVFRTERELLAEVLELVRSQSRTVSGNISKKALLELGERYAAVVFEATDTGSTPALLDRLWEMRRPLRYILTQSGSEIRDLLDDTFRHLRSMIDSQSTGTGSSSASIDDDEPF